MDWGKLADAMSPRAVFLLTLVGVLIAGAPLPWLTGASAPAEPAAAEAAPAARQLVYATLRATGKPEKLQLRLHGELLAEVTGDLPWDGDLSLPEGCEALDIEVETAWPEPGEQAVTLTLEPDGRDARSCTRWAGTGTMHDVFNFVW